MARAANAVAENAPGDFFVDQACIDCDLCRRIAPATFEDAGAHSFVAHQPRTPDARRAAFRALVTCPTSAIGTARPDPRAAREAAGAYPEPVPGHADVFFCGYASESSFGASSWLIRRPSGNVLVDSPRAARPLFDRIDALGGVRWLFLSHRDDVADHDKIAARFGCERVLHVDDVTRDTAVVERKIRGRDPVRLDEDLLLIPTPGHTRGSTSLLWRDEILFTGDHLWATPDGALSASRSVCWWSWPEQKKSMARLLEHDFRAVLPGHERPYFAESTASMRDALHALLMRM